MNYYLVKTSIRRDEKLKKEIYVVKDEGFDLAGFRVVTNLKDFDDGVIVTDVNLKNYIAVYMLDEGDGPIYEVSLEFDDIETGKAIKETYLQQANSTKEAEDYLLENLGDPAVEITNTKKTNIINYFKEEK